MAKAHALLVPLLLIGCGPQYVVAPAPLRPDFQKALVMRCMAGAALLDVYMMGFQSFPTSERIEFLTALELSPCPPEAVAWLEKMNGSKAGPAVPPQPVPKPTP